VNPTLSRILLVEDDLDIREALREVLVYEGYEVTLAINGHEALEQLKSKSDGGLPQLILLDLMMPVKDGLGFLQEQQANSRLAPIPVVLMSADQGIEARARQLNVKACLKKPVEIDNLLSTIEAVR
jgi:CheY-like chemotaxis protein